MNALTDDQLWHRVRSLQGRTVYTIQQRKPNTVSQVTDTEVRMLKSSGEPRPSTPLDRKLSEVMSSCTLEFKAVYNVAEKCIAAVT